MRKHNISIARIARGKRERTEVGSWLIEVFTTIDIRLNMIYNVVSDYIPTYVSRNHVVEKAKEQKASILYMIDDDMLPAKGFFKKSLDFLLRNPCAMCTSPYMGAPPKEEMMIYKLNNNKNKLLPYEKEEAFNLTGITEVAATGTGLVAINMEIFDKLKKPYFSYEYTDDSLVELTSTEDIVFCKKLLTEKIPIYCFWDYFSGHAKGKIVGKHVLEY